MRFRAGSPAARALAESADTAEVAAALKAATAVPLRAKQVLSGGMLLVELDADRIAARVAAALEPRGDVAFARRGPDEKAPVVVCLAPAAGAGGCKPATADDAARLAAALERELDLPLAVEVSPAGELLVRADSSRATERAREDLARHSDVEFVEPNLLFRPSSPARMP